MRVIDSSSVAKFLNKEENWEKVEKVLQGGCVSLELVVKETGNSLWKRVHRGLLDSGKAQTVFREFTASRPFELVDQESLYDSAFKIAVSSDIPFYDALFLALSKVRQIPLVTSDSTQAEAARKLRLSVEFVP